jgi:hypothetical protein
VHNAIFHELTFEILDNSARCAVTIILSLLKVFADVADRLARAAGSHWPEPRSFPEEKGSQAFSRIIKQWVFRGANRPPIAVAILFPAIVFGIGALVQYFRRQRP